MTSTTAELTLPESTIILIGSRCNLKIIGDMLNDEQYKIAVPILMAFGEAVAAYTKEMLQSHNNDVIGPPRHLSVDRRRGVDRRLSEDGSLRFSIGDET